VKSEVLILEEASFSWTATGGNLLYDDLQQVHWRAPASPGRYTLGVSVSSGKRPSAKERAVGGSDVGDTALEEIVVDVRRPDTTDMVWIPGSCGLQPTVES